ncbi:MAG: DUF2203 family protein [Acidobacteria bacterium]|nr:DUF2203 family protein [Acidobacteriota bacterium]
MPRFFNLREAQELLPHVRAWLEEALVAKSSVEDIDGELQALAAHVVMSGGVEIDPVAVVRKKLRRQEEAERAEQAVRSIEGAGCIVKDVENGLIDFPALLDGHEVYLCWKRGEARIEHWHKVEDGFAGRRRIGDEFGDDPGSGLRPN